MKKAKPCQTCSCPSDRRCSSRKTAVLAALSEADRHLSADELHRLARKRSPGIGIATVYRSVKCLCGCGKAVEVKLGDGAALYEAASPRSPLAHLVCSGCGAVAEASVPELDRLARGAAAGAGFTLSVIELRGFCRRCSAERKGGRK